MNDPTPRRDGDWLDDDDNLLDALRAASESADPVPSRLADGARAAFTWRTLDTELAELQFDSAVDATSVRGLAWPRQLSFDSTDVSVEIEIDHDRLVGQVIPPAEVDVTLTDSAGQTRSIRSDAVGHFAFTEVESGTVRIRAELPGGSVTTQWFTL